jgi:hypothetical protein
MSVERCDFLTATTLVNLTPSDGGTQTVIFMEAVDQSVSHLPKDGLDNSRIPIQMKPDRVIGLYLDGKNKKELASKDLDLTHCLVKQRDLICPFLVIEAKKEENVPGFRAIETQTAFSIRRFLKIQADLRMASQMNHEPLVWFCAFQGDEWRLYAATLDDKTVVRHDTPRTNIRGNS